VGKHHSIRAIGLAAALSITAGLLATPAHAEDTTDPAAIEAATAANAAAGQPEVPQAMSPDGTAADTSEGTATVSTDPDEGLTATGATGTDVSLGVPGSPDEGTVIAGNVVYPGVADDASVVARPTQDGTQALIVIDGSDAPSRYTFPVEVNGEHTGLRQGNDGAVDILGADGTTPVATIAPPWATDANGDAVPTHYEIEGSSIIQVVEHETAAYPVTADPKVSFGWSIYLKYSKKEVKDFKSKGGVIGAATLVAAVCKALPNSIVMAICAATVAVASAAILNTFTQAAKENKCVELKFAYDGDLDGWKRYKC
jgi:hypothetical protein